MKSKLALGLLAIAVSGPINYGATRSIASLECNSVTKSSKSFDEHTKKNVQCLLESEGLSDNDAKSLAKVVALKTSDKKETMRLKRNKNKKDEQLDSKTSLVNVEGVTFINEGLEISNETSKLEIDLNKIQNITQDGTADAASGVIIPSEDDIAAIDDTVVDQDGNPVKKCETKNCDTVVSLKDEDQCETKNCDTVVSLKDEDQCETKNCDTIVDQDGNTAKVKEEDKLTKKKSAIALSSEFNQKYGELNESAMLNYLVLQQQEMMNSMLNILATLANQNFANQPNPYLPEVNYNNYTLSGGYSLMNPLDIVGSANLGLQMQSLTDMLGSQGISGIYGNNRNHFMNGNTNNSAPFTNHNLFYANPSSISQ